MQGNQNEEIARYAILTQAILGDPQLSSTDKIVLGRISGFERFYESAEATAQFCGLSERQVKTAKRKLEKLGYIVTIENTGRGKAFRTAPDYLWNSGRHTENCNSDIQKTAHQTYRKLHPENKERLKEELNVQGTQAGPVEKSKETKEQYGDPNINEFMQKWASATGNDLSNKKRERRAAQNIIKSQSKEGIAAILEAVQQIHTTGDQYAPAITAPSDLIGEYSKLPKLRLWVARHQQQPKSKMGRLVLDYDGLPPAYEVSEADREAVKNKFKEMRKNGEMPFKIKQEDEKE